VAADFRAVAAAFLTGLLRAGATDFLAADLVVFFAGATDFLAADLVVFFAGAADFLTGLLPAGATDFLAADLTGTPALLVAARFAGAAFFFVFLMDSDLTGAARLATTSGTPRSTLRRDGVYPTITS